MKKLLISIIFAFSCPLLFGDGSAIALCYHTFIGLDRDDYDFSPAEFEEQINTMIKMGYHFVSFDDILENNVSGKMNVLITLDDGNRSIRNIYKSILEKYGIKPVLFIYPAIIGRRHYALSYRDLKEYENDGACIGAHGYNHLFINEKLYEKDNLSFNREIFKSKEVLEKKLPAPVTLFAYPFGSFSDITVEYIIKAHYQYAFTIQPGLIKIPLNKNENTYSLHRYLVTKSGLKQVFRALRENAHPSEHASKRKIYENI